MLEPVQRIPRYRLLLAGVCVCVCVGGRRRRGREEGVWCRSESLHVGACAKNTKILAVCLLVCVCVGGGGRDVCVEEGKGDGRGVCGRAHIGGRNKL